jgi:hypothetical protein
MTDKRKILSAQRLARTIASDLLLYNREKVERGIQEDNLFKLLEAEIREGRELYKSRVSSEIIDTYQFLDRAIVDILIASQAELDCSIW